MSVKPERFSINRALIKRSIPCITTNGIPFDQMNKSANYMILLLPL